jgi:hypothetical protein
MIKIRIFVLQRDVLSTLPADDINSNYEPGKIIFILWTFNDRDNRKASIIKKGDQGLPDERI